MHALGAFQKRLPSGTSKTSIGLKYPCKALDGTVYWSDIEAAQESREMWMELMIPGDAQRFAEVGVFVEDEPPAVPPIEPVGPLIGRNGLPVKARVRDNTETKWLAEAGHNQLGHPLPTCLPPTYQVRPYFYGFIPWEYLKNYCLVPRSILNI